MNSPSVGTLQAQLQSARKSLLFMETQHADTLKGLHAEIQQLQKKCSELTFDVAMNGQATESDHENAIRIQQLETDVSDLTREKISMVQELEERDRQFVELEENARELEKKYLNELKVKSHKMSVLANELDSRSNTIGYLTAQLHQARSKLHSITQQQQKHENNLLSPTPPVQPKRPHSKKLHKTSNSADGSFRPSSSGSRGTRPISRPSSASSLGSGNDADRVQPTKHPTLLKSRFNPSPMPDPTPFLHAGENSSDAIATIVPNPPSVLPPIHKRRSATSLRDANGNALYESSPQWQNYQKPDTASRSERRRDTRIRETEEIAVRRMDTRLSPEREVSERRLRHFN